MNELVVLIADLLVLGLMNEIDESSPLNYGTPSSRLGSDTPRTPGALGTPHRVRSDIRGGERRPTVNMTGGSESVS
jgi:hypothetical protein